MIVANGDYPVAASRPSADSYDAIWPRLQAVLLEQIGAVQDETTAAQAHLAKLVAVDWAQRAAVIERSVKYHSAALCLLLLDRSAVVAVESPWEAEQFGQLSLLVAAHLHPSHHPSSLRADLIARSWMSVADARRRRSDWAGAEEALEAADAALAGSCDALEEAEFCRLLSLLRRQQGQLIEAAALEQRARNLSRRDQADPARGQRSRTAAWVTD